VKFCKRCFDRMAAKWAKKVNYDPRHVLNVKKMCFPCQIPLHESDTMSGEPMVRIWNCKTNKFDIYTLKRYNEKKSRGEFE
jgi:hypothetical protein